MHSSSTPSFWAISDGFTGESQSSPPVGVHASLVF